MHKNVNCMYCSHSCVYYILNALLRLPEQCSGLFWILCSTAPAAGAVFSDTDRNCKFQNGCSQSLILALAGLLQYSVKPMTHSPEIVADFWTVCHTDLVPDFSGTIFWRRSVACSISCRLRDWYTRDHYGDR